MIIQFWHDSSDIPKDVKKCLDSWSILKRQGFNIVLYDNDKATRFILANYGKTYVSAFKRCHHPAMQCDYFRLCYIYAKGGFYVDADEIYQGTSWSRLYQDDRLKVQPLCYDVSTRTMIDPREFIFSREFSVNWIFYLNNNPIIAPPHHPVIKSALTTATRTLINSRGKKLDIQSTTGPGNLTVSLLTHYIESKNSGAKRDFHILHDWEELSISPWQLEYRMDDRNWRRWKP